MTKKSKWFLGCGLGCVGLIAVAAFLVVGGIALVRDTRRGFEGSEKSRKTLVETFGTPGEFVPAADGSIPAERLEIFLAVRGATQEYRNGIQSFFSTMPTNEQARQELQGKPFGERIGSVLGNMKSAMGMGEDIGNLLEARNRVLLEKGMGLGEYTYIYVLAYYSWLGHSPDDGPGRNSNESMIMRRSRSDMHNELIRMLSNQLDALEDEPVAEQQGSWRSDLANEIEAMKSDEERVPWQDGLPRKAAESLEPFRDRLAQSYSPLVNPFELSLPTTRNLFNFGNN